jgi:tRNA 2-thiouridine synthesizing protein A
MEEVLSRSKLGEEHGGKWSGNSGAQKIDKELNLKGKICPYTFIESMLVLDEMQDGEVLKVIVDYAPAVCDVPKSLESEGYEILDVSAINDTDWAILVKNREFVE